MFSLRCTPFWLVAVLNVAMSAIPPCALKSRGYRDPNITTLNGGMPVDAQACQDLCAIRVGCQGWTYYITSHGCWLEELGSLPPMQDIEGVWSGPQACPNNVSAMGAVVNGSENASIVAGAAVNGATSKGLVVPGVFANGQAPEGVVAPGANGTNFTGIMASGGPGSTAAIAVTGEHKAEEGGWFPSWLAVLIGLIVLAAIAAITYFTCFAGEDKAAKKKKKKKLESKRASRLEADEEDELVDSEGQTLHEVSVMTTAREVEVPLMQGAPATASGMYVAAPVYAQSVQVHPMQAAQVATTAVPTYSYAAPVAAPVVSGMQPVQMLAEPIASGLSRSRRVSSAVTAMQSGYVTRTTPPVPQPAASVQTMAQAPSMQSYQMHLMEPVASNVPRNQDLFDRLDVNHDGVLTRNEFGQMFR